MSTAAMRSPLRVAGAANDDIALVIADESTGSAIGELCRARGYDVLAPGTPLDAIHTLVSVGDRIGVVLVVPGTTWATGLREFLADEYPSIEQIVLT